MKFVPIVVVDESTIGDSPETVTDSCSVATVNCASSVSVVLITTRMFSRVIFWKPGNSKLRV